MKHEYMMHEMQGLAYKFYGNYFNPTPFKDVLPTPNNKV